MNLEQQRAASEALLAQEADSLGALLAQLRDRISPVLIGGAQWRALLDRARDLPPTLGAFPFGFELPLHEDRPGADLGVSVVGGTRAAAFYEEQGQCQDANPTAAGIARLLHETEPEDSPLRQVVGRKMMLEYDVESAPGGTHPDPGIFLRPAERPIFGDGDSRRSQDIGVVLEAIVSAAGWRADSAEHRVIERVHRAQGRGVRIESFGVFPARERAIRLAVTGFRTSRDVVAFLESAGWSGSHSRAGAAVSRFEDRDAFVSMGVHFDVHADGLGPTLGLSFLAKERVANDPRYWVDSPRLWAPFLDSLREGGLAVPDKLSALARWSSGVETLFGAGGPYVLMRGIHHVKLVLGGDRIEQAKGYVYFLICAWPQGGQSAT